MGSSIPVGLALEAEEFPGSVLGQEPLLLVKPDLGMAWALFCLEMELTSGGR